MEIPSVALYSRKSWLTHWCEINKTFWPWFAVLHHYFQGSTWRTHVQSWSYLVRWTQSMQRPHWDWRRPKVFKKRGASETRNYFPHLAPEGSQLLRRGAGQKRRVHRLWAAKYRRAQMNGPSGISLLTLYWKYTLFHASRSRPNLGLDEGCRSNRFCLAFVYFASLVDTNLEIDLVKKTNEFLKITYIFRIFNSWLCGERKRSGFISARWLKIASVLWVQNEFFKRESLKCFSRSDPKAKLLHPKIFW